MSETPELQMQPGFAFSMANAELIALGNGSDIITGCRFSAQALRNSPRIP
jgi:hypothetical protein